MTHIARVAPLIGLAALIAPLISLVGGLLACGTRGPAPMFDARLGNDRLRIPLEILAAWPQLAPGEAFAVVEVGRDAHTSHHMVAIRDREVPHRHDRHDLMVVMLRGHGSWRLGDQVHEVGEGSILYVPRGTAHAFANATNEPAIAYAVYSPAFDGHDRQSEVQ